MKKFLTASLLLLAAPLAAKAPNVYQSGWWTGPLFASHARTIPAGKINLQPYFGYYVTQGNYTNDWSIQSAPHFSSLGPIAYINLGLTESLDFAAAIPWMYNTFLGNTASGLGDVALGFSYQLMKDDNGGPLWDILFFIREYLPTGKFTNLRPDSAGVDATGYGAFITDIGFNAQKIFLMDNGKLFRLRLNIAYELPAVTHVQGLNAYGGGVGTKGKIWADATFFFTAAYEIQLTQNWVFACDYMYEHGGQAKFSGDPGLAFGRATSFTNIASNGYPAWDSFSVAPAIEYNFNEDMGIIAGLWVSVAGRNNAAFISPLVAFNVVF